MTPEQEIDDILAEAAFFRRMGTPEDIVAAGVRAQILDAFEARGDDEALADELKDAEARAEQAEREADELRDEVQGFERRIEDLHKDHEEDMKAAVEATRANIARHLGEMRFEQPGREAEWTRHLMQLIESGTV